MDILKDMSRLERIGRNRYFGVIDGKKIGAVLATKNPSFDDPAINKSDLDRVVGAKHDGRLDVAKVVAAKTNGNGGLIFYDSIDAEVLQKQLWGLIPRVGRFGDFFTIPAGVGFPARDESEPF
jgi:hypothetical protein